MTHTPEVVIVDDDAAMREMVELILKREGFLVIPMPSAQQALEHVQQETPDLFILDAMMPEVDGITLCRRLRAYDHTASTPVLFLTGRGDRYGVVDALSSGADDYLRKPFQPKELIARVRALIRRSAFYHEGAGVHVRFNIGQGRVFINDQEVSLTRVEYELLCFLSLNPHHLYSTEDLLLNVWQYPNGVGDAALVRNHIRNLRRKIEQDPERPMLLQSRHGRGYMVRARVEFTNVPPDFMRGTAIASNAVVEKAVASVSGTLSAQSS